MQLSDVIVHVTGNVDKWPNRELASLHWNIGETRVLGAWKRLLAERYEVEIGESIEHFTLALGAEGLYQKYTVLDGKLKYLFIYGLE